MNLTGKVQHYDWGSRDASCNVYTMATQNDPKYTCQVSDGKLQRPHAEFWVGTHVNGPALIKKTGVPLSEYLAEHPDELGEKVVQQYGTELPFLLKVLSVNKPLSIQAHPNKAHAEELHAKFPDIYKDPNHKPEMLVALTDFRMLRGFRKIPDIQGYFQAVPELRGVVGATIADELCSPEAAGHPDRGREALKAAYRALMTAPQEIISQALSAILARVQNLDEVARGACLADLLEQLHGHFPGDVGCLSLYFLQDFTMKPGESAYLPANQIHAYLSGECVEIMACSDNVVRGGLTPKLKDVDTLCAMLDYEPADLKPGRREVSLGDNCTKYVPHGVSEFALVHVKVGSKYRSLTLPNNGCACVVLALGPSNFCLEGDPMEELKRGQVIFIPADQNLVFASSPWQEDAVSDVFVAQCNL